MNAHSKTFTLIGAVVLATAALTSTAAVAEQQTTYMTVDSLSGEVTDAHFQGAIQLLNYSQSFGTKACSQVVVVKQIDRTSPGLIGFAASSYVVPTVRIQMVKAGRDQQVFFTATLTSVLVDRVELNDSPNPPTDSDLPVTPLGVTERIAMKPKHIQIQFQAQRGDGSLGTPTIASVDCSQTSVR
jgi:type VI protein secretion system component Hcp